LENKRKQLAINIVNDIIDVSGHDDDGADSWCDLHLPVPVLSPHKTQNKKQRLPSKTKKQFNKA
jgi:hypothetical protein